MLAERGADRRRRTGLTADRLQLDFGEDFLCQSEVSLDSAHRLHYSFLTWSKPTSTGVSRPKIETSTLSF